MIQTNLLPYHLRPVKRSPLPYIASLAVLIVALAAMAGVGLSSQAQIVVGRGRLAAHQSDYEGLRTFVDEFKQLQAQKERLADKIAIIQDIVGERIIWSEQLWSISRLTPENFWFSNITEKEKSRREKRYVYNSKTKKEELKTVTVKHRVLELAGYVIEGADGTNNIYPLTFNLEQDPAFSALFQLSLPRLGDTEFNGYEVRSFTLEYRIQSGDET